MKNTVLAHIIKTRLMQIKILKRKNTIFDIYYKTRIQNHGKQNKIYIYWYGYILKQNKTKNKKRKRKKGDKRSYK